VEASRSVSTRRQTEPPTKRCPGQPGPTASHLVSFVSGDRPAAEHPLRLEGVDGELAAGGETGDLCVSTYGSVAPPFGEYGIFTQPATAATGAVGKSERASSASSTEEAPLAVRGPRHQAARAAVAVRKRAVDGRESTGTDRRRGRASTRDQRWRGLSSSSRRGAFPPPHHGPRKLACRLTDDRAASTAGRGNVRRRDRRHQRRRWEAPPQ
jgi:hypothetical protein